MKREKPTYEKMYAELEQYERKGVCILMDGQSASPMQVVKAHMARENVSYMRDYEIDSNGKLEALSFININRRRRRNFQPQKPLYAEKLKKEKIRDLNCGKNMSNWQNTNDVRKKYDIIIFNCMINNVSCICQLTVI